MKNTNKLLETLLRFGRRTREPDTASKPVRSVPRTGDEFAALGLDWNGGGDHKLTASLLRNLLHDADDGDVSGLAELYRQMLEREPVIAAHLQTRTLSVLSCDWSVRDGDPDRAAELENLLRKAGIRDLLQHLLSALAYGYAGAAIEWDEGGKAIRTFQPVHPANWRFDRGGNPAVRTLTGEDRALAEYHPTQFVFHTYRLQSGGPGRGGLLRPLLWLYFFKYYAMRDRARYLERFGIPFIAAKIRTEDFESDSVRCEIMNSLSKLGSDGVGLLSEGSEMQVVTANSNSSGDYQAWLDYLDRLSTLLILGQTASSGDASGFSRGQMQENVRRDLIEADCRALMETVESQILRPLELYRFGTVGTFHFELDYLSPESLLDKAEMVKALTAFGCTPDRAWVEKTFGIPLAAPAASLSQPQQKD